MEITDVKAGSATLAMTVGPQMVNGHGIAHGGFIFTLADSAFAFACNSHNERAVAAQGNITFIRPGKLGDRLVATASEISRSGRSGIYDVRVTVNGIAIAEFRGHSRTIGGVWVPDAEMTRQQTQPLLLLDDAERASRDEITGAANQAHGVDAEACLRQCRALQKGI